MTELLSPAGSPEAVIAAVQSGANAVYLGCGSYNARRNAKNFSIEELESAVEYCHVRGARVFLTMNTLLRDRELEGAAELAVRASDAGVDAILVQDLGTAELLSRVVPDVELHASTQMTVHSLEGVLRCADMGMTRAVLSRELSKDAIAHICAHSPIEIEIFVHGALCMCYSGQCFFSSVIGRRSGNRGLCAQPCRLSYGWNGRADSNPLSLKDMSLAGHLSDLKEMGVACLKIEGRMKRPEYVAIVTGVYSRALREGRDPTAEELRDLQAAFSRQGFTDGYFTGRKGAHMFGIREEAEDTRALFASARADYENRENPLVPVRFSAGIFHETPARLMLSDGDGNTVSVSGPVPEPARSRALDSSEVSARLSKTGGTPYYCVGADAEVERGLSLPASAINAMRREAIERLTQARGALPARRRGDFSPPSHLSGFSGSPAISVSLRRADQFSDGLLSRGVSSLWLPAAELHSHPDIIAHAQERGVRVGVVLPRICWDSERAVLQPVLEALGELGVSDALVGTLDLLKTAERFGFTPHADFGIGVFNSMTAEKLASLGFSSQCASFELMLAQIRGLSKPIPTEMIAYGRLPLMITENCIIRCRTGKCSCTGNERLTDRQGERFPVLHASGQRCEIFNAKTLYLADKLDELRSLGLSSIRLSFTTENAEACAQVVHEYLCEGRFNEKEHTRGLYFRGVE